MAWLNYHHLYYFWVVAHEGSISAATRKLNLTQPTISAQLRQLEESLGEKLFEKSGRGLMLVDMLADVWGVESRGSGKCVWCEFIVPARDTQG